MLIRPATVEDAPGMSAALTELTAAGKRVRPDDIGFVLATYLADPGRIECSVAVDEDGTILGFQSLNLAEIGNPYGVTPGWGTIGTHIRPHAARTGCGRALFAATRAAARKAGITRIDASIGADNAEGRAYYDAMGFHTYRTPDDLDCKVWRAEDSAP